MKDKISIVRLILSVICIINIGCKDNHKNKNISSGQVKTDNYIASNVKSTFSSNDLKNATQEVSKSYKNQLFDQYFLEIEADIEKVYSDSLLIYLTYSDVGSKSYLLGFDRENEIKDILIKEIMDSDGDESNGAYVEYRWLSDTLIEVTNNYDPSNDDIFYDYYEIKSKKIIDPVEVKAHPDRKYGMGSYKWLESNDLRGLKKQELRLIRNEIFASYGHTFKDSVLNEYFNKTTWYKPVKNNLSYKLSIIEKHNVLLIKQLENKN